jgi:glycosyltransferase involved in cell wall biosynthesis
VRLEVLTSSWPQSRDDPSGHFVAAGVEALRAAGAQVGVRTLFPGVDHAELPTHSWSTVAPARGGAIYWARRHPLQALGLAARSPQFLAGLSRADRVVCHWAWPLPMLAQVAGVRPERLRTVCHGSGLRLVRRVAGVALGRPHPVAVVAEHQLLDLPVGWRPAAHVLPVPISRGTAPTRQIDRVVVFVGRLIAAKGVGDLPALLDQLPGWRACVVGEGPLRPVLEADARIDCLGPLPADRWPRIIPSGVGWIPTRLPEGAPLVVDELRRAGCPVVASASIGLCSRIRPGVDGWLVAGGDLGRYAQRIEQARASHTRSVARPRTTDWKDFVDWVLA